MSLFRRTSRNHVLVAVLAAVVLAHTMVASPSGATVSVRYGTTKRDFKNASGGNTSLTVRGWIDDVCLYQDLSCLSEKSGKRGETTAQAKVIRQLSWELNKPLPRKPTIS